MLWQTTSDGRCRANRWSEVACQLVYMILAFGADIWVESHYCRIATVCVNACGNTEIRRRHCLEVLLLIALVYPVPEVFMSSSVPILSSFGNSRVGHLKRSGGIVVRGILTGSGHLLIVVWTGESFALRAQGDQLDRAFVEES